MLKIGFIGAGTVGSALALQLSMKGYTVVAASSLDGISAEKLAESLLRLNPGQSPRCQAVRNNQAVADNADLVFITTPDGIIGKVAGEVNWHSGQSVVHCSGADSAAILEPARKLGADIGAFHPLQTFAGIEQAIENTPGSTFAIEAEGMLRFVLKKMASALGSHCIELKQGDKAVYHTSAVMASNYLVTLVKMATDLWVAMGIPREEAVRALMPLLKGTLYNIETLGFPDCLTGPVSRGDAGTVEKHIQALDSDAAELLPVYVELALQTIPIALAKGKITEEQAEKLVFVLKETNTSVRLAENEKINIPP